MICSRSILTPIVQALGVLAATAMAAFSEIGDPLWLAAPLVLAMSTLALPWLGGRAIVTAGVVAFAGFVVSAVIALLDPESLALVLATVGGGGVVALNDTQSCRTRRRLHAHASAAR